MTPDPVPSLTSPGAELAELVVVRPARPEDIDTLFFLIAQASRTTTVLPRTRESIQAQLEHFRVAEVEGQIIGCAQLALFTRGLAEVKSLVIEAAARGRGVGGLIVAALVEHARAQNVRRIFALTDNVRFFRRQGFREVSKATLPHKVWNECIKCPKFLNCEEDAVELWLGPEEL